MLTTSEFATISIDDELAAFLADYDVYTGVDGLIPVETAAIDPDAAPADPTVMNGDSAALLDGVDPTADTAIDTTTDAVADDFIPLDPGSIDPDAATTQPAAIATADTAADDAPVVDPMMPDDGDTFVPSTVDPAADLDTVLAVDSSDLSLASDPAADAGAGIDLVLTFEDLDLGSEMGMLMVGRSLHGFDFTSLP